jgi:CRISPR-associated DxTHG motif protein
MVIKHKRIEMKKAVITTLGMINHDKAEYLFNKIKYKKLNTLPLLIEYYKDEYEIRPIATQKSLEIQEKVLQREGINKIYLEDTIVIPDTEEYDIIFKKINDIINDYDEIIVDISHGFRHLPILIIINLIVQNIVNPDKITSILFAKETVKKKKYEMIDLIDYLDLSNIAFTLARFSENYTVSRNVKFRDKAYENLIGKLSEFSFNLLGNSIKNLTFEDSKTASLIERIIKDIDTLEKKDKKIENLKDYLLDIKNHLQEMQNYSKLDSYLKIYNFANIMFNKWYMLNAITLLNEALGLYCVHSFSKYDNKVKKASVEYEKKDRQATYYSSNESATLIKKYNDNFRTDNTRFLTNDIVKIINLELKKINVINNLAFKSFKELIENVSNMRNNLAHANSGEAISKVKNEIKQYIKQFEALCIETNILKKIPNDIEIPMKETRKAATYKPQIKTAGGLKIKKKEK